ncbi:MAG: DUF6261 family protein [Odoribacteraceae bacterium]|nr:DUF6261 family protein [Odoribacteraceae bacterium]
MAVIKRLGAGAIGIKEASDELILAVNDVLAYLDFLRGSLITPDIKDQDFFRDSIARVILLKAHSKLYDPSADKRLAARNVVRVLKNYRDIPRKSYDDSTAAVDDLLQELNKPAMLPNITDLKLADDIADLAAANTRFFELMQTRYREANERPTVPMREARARAEELQQKLVQRVEAIVVLNGLDFSPELTSFVQEYNAIAKRYKNIMAAEKGRRKAYSGRKSGKNDEASPEDLPDAPAPDVALPEYLPLPPSVNPVPLKPAPVSLTVTPAPPKVLR